MKKSKDYSRVMISDSIYTLLIYFLISSKEEIDNTFFFFSDGIPRRIGDNLNSHYFTKRSFCGTIRLFIRVFTHLFSFYRWPFLKTAEVFGHDHLFFIPPLLGRRGMNVIEDGTANYDKTKFLSRKKKKKFKELIYGARVNQPILGGSQWDKRVILTGLGEVPDMLKSRAEIVDIKALWAAKTPEFKNWLLALYGIEESALNALKGRNSLMVAQVFDRYGVRESVIIEVYRNMLKDVEPKDLVIKPHPASNIDLGKYFPEAYILRGKIPMEIFTLIGVEFKDVYTVSSTAVLSMPKSVNMHFTGTSIHPEILRCIGPIEYSDFVKE